MSLLQKLGLMPEKPAKPEPQHFSIVMLHPINRGEAVPALYRHNDQKIIQSSLYELASRYVSDTFRTGGSISFTPPVDYMTIGNDVFALRRLEDEVKEFDSYLKMALVMKQSGE